MDNDNLIRDVMDDLRNERKFIRKICVILCMTIILLIFGIIGTSIYNQNKIFRFVNETEFDSTIEMNNDNSTNFGNITAK